MEVYYVCNVDRSMCDYITSVHFLSSTRESKIRYRRQQLMSYWNHNKEVSKAFDLPLLKRHFMKNWLFLECLSFKGEIIISS